MKKNIFTKILGLFSTVLLFTFISCLDNLEFSNKTGTSYDESYNGKGCTVKLLIDDCSVSRTALPDISKKDLRSLHLTGYNPDTKTSYRYGPWVDAEEMENDSILVEKGTQIFTLYAYSGSSIYDATAKVNISGGETTIPFSLVYAGNSTTVHGKGNIDIHAAFPLKDGSGKQDLKLVTAELDYLSGNTVPGYAEEELSFDSAGNAHYSKTGVKNGSYYVLFMFYADTEKKNLICIYPELVNVSIGHTSSSDISIDSFTNVYPITYNLFDNGEFAEGTKVPTFYSKYTSFIELPIPTPKSDLFEFDGWYEADPETGALTKKIEYIDLSQIRPLNLVAKWNRNIEITLNANEGKFKITKDGVTTDEDTVTIAYHKEVEKNLPTANSLNLSSPMGMTHFVGWSKLSNATQLDTNNGDYTDAGTAIFTEDTTLYAIYSTTPVIVENSDRDKDGLSDLEEIKLGTDPNSSDTDGDGWTDKEELELYNKDLVKFNPCVADVPSIKLTMIGQPVISYNFSTSTGKSESETVSTSEGINHSESNSSSHGTTSSATHGWNVSIKESYSWQKDKEGFTLEGTQGASGSYSNGSSYTFSQGECESQSKTFSQGKAYSNNSAKTVTGGTVKMTLRVTNNGEIAYTVNSFNATLYRIASVSHLTKDDKKIVSTVSHTPDKGFKLAPDESVDLVVSFTLSNPDKVEDLLSRSSGFFIAPSGFNISMSDGNRVAPKDFTYDLTKVRAKTARISIDYGVENKEKKEETYFVSTKFKYNKDATSINNEYSPVSLKEILEKVGISEGDKNLTLTDGKISGIRNVMSKGSLKDGDWYILHIHKSIDGDIVNMYNSFDSKSTSNYDLDKIIVSAQDTVHIFYDRDEDGDGVPLTEEIINGCSDNNPDSDGDGLTDYQELYGFERNGKTYHTNPMNSDTDGDSEDGFDLSDYDDPNPVDPLRKDIARLASLKFGQPGKELNEYTGDLKDQRNIILKESGNIAEYGEYLVLQAQGKYLGSRLFYGIAKENGSVDEYTEFENEVEIPLPNGGNNSISLKVRSPDDTTETFYTITLNSAYNPLEGFRVSSLKAKEASIAWDRYADSRFEGYLLHVKKADSQYENATIDKTVIQNAGGMLQSGGEDFFVAVDQDTALSGVIKVTNIAAGENYYFALYGYGNTTKTEVSSKLLAMKKVAMAIPEQGKLKLYAHYVEAIEDLDGVYDPDYYWTFKSGGTGDVKFDYLSDFSISEGAKIEFDDNDQIYYDFETKTNTMTNRPDLGYTKVATATIDRNAMDNKTVVIHWSCFEQDVGSDDPLGTKNITLTYHKKYDYWSVTIDGDIFAGSDDDDRKKKSTKESNDKGTLYRDGQTHLCYLYTNSSDGHVKVWLSLEWTWD